VSNCEVISAATSSTPDIDPSTIAVPATTPISGPTVTMWDPYSRTQQGPQVPATGVIWTNPATGQSADSGAITAAYEHYFGKGTELELQKMQEEWGAGNVQKYLQANPSIDNTQNLNDIGPLTAFQEIGPDQIFYDPNNGNQACFFNYSGVEFLSDHPEGSGAI
jgi:hypothetical protein